MRTPRKRQPGEPIQIGPPVNWDVCLGCGFVMYPNQERFRIEKDGKIGVGHKECRG